MAKEIARDASPHEKTYSAHTLRAISGAIVLAGTSLVFDITHYVIGIPIYPGYIDLAGFPWVLSYLLFGFWPSMLTAISATVLISFDPTGIAGAGVKFAATLPQILIFALFARVLHKKASISLKRIIFYVPTAVIALFARVFIAFYSGTYIFGPIFFHTSPQITMEIFPFWLYVVLNVPQGTVDMAVAWFLAYPTNLVKRYATW